MSANWEKPVKSEQAARPYRGELRPLEADDYQYFQQRYEFVPHIFRGDSGRYLIPIYGPRNGGPRNGVPRGWVARIPWPDSPLSKEWFKPFPKADTFIDKPGPVQSWHRADFPVNPRILVLVEDQLSAMKLANLGYDAVAMLGVPNSAKSDNYSGQDRVAEIAQYSAGYESVVVAFDPDATDQSFMFVRKWGSAFHPPVRVAILERDIKDMMREDIPRVLGVDKC
jgi:hypothetical protein